MGNEQYVKPSEVVERRFYRWDADLSGAHEVCKHGHPVTRNGADLPVWGIDLCEECFPTAGTFASEKREQAEAIADSPSMCKVLAEHNITSAEQLRERLRMTSPEAWETVHDGRRELEQRAEKAERELDELRASCSPLCRNSVSPEQVAQAHHRLAHAEASYMSIASHGLEPPQRGPVIRCDHGWDGDDT